jgi:hypothetical protein
MDDPGQASERDDELARAAELADPVEGFQLDRPTADELDADDGYVDDEGGEEEAEDEVPDEDLETLDLDEDDLTADVADDDDLESI